MHDKPLSDLTPAERRALLKELLRKKTAPETQAPPTLVPDPGARFEPFPPTAIQEAYLLGRRPGFTVSGVGCHAYSECDTGAIDPDRLEAAWNALVARHDMLRAVVTADAVRVLPDVPVYRFARLDLRGRPAADVDATLARIGRELATSFRDPGVWPPFEVRLTRLADDRWRLHVDLDLMTIDAAATLRIVHEWGRLYAGESLPALPALSFRDYRLALRTFEDGPAARQARAYWEPRLATLPGPPDLPLVADPHAAATAPTRRTFRLSPARWAEFRAQAQAHGVTPNAALATAFSAALSAYSHNDAHALTVTLFDRQPLHPDVGQLLGEFTNTLLLEVRGRAGSFAARAQALQTQLTRDLEHTAWSGVHVVRELNRRRGGITSFPVVFTSTLASRAGATPGGWLGEWTAGASQTPQVFLDHQIFEEDGGLRINWDTVDAVFAPGVIAALFAGWSALVERLADGPAAWDAPVGPLLPASQLAARAAVQTWPGEPATDTLHDPFLRQAAATPDALAVTSATQSLSYRALADLSEHLACRLAHVLSTSPSQLVAVCLPKSPQQAIATLGILRSGAAYLPIDPDLPHARIRTLLLDGQASIVVTDPATAEKLRESLEGAHIEPVLTDTPAPAIRLPHVPPDALAYVIYTSGSTGHPKGVAIQHQAAWNTIAAINAQFSLTPTDRVLALSALSFDLSVYDLFGLLAVGGALVYPPPDGLRDPATWPLDQVTLWNSVPQLMEMLLESGRPLPPSLRLVLWSGDWIPLSLPARVRQQLPHATLVSLGGATEAAIWSIAHLIHDIDPAWTSIPYGTPLPHQSFHVLDDSLSPRPDGVQGELYIGGAGLAQGYWHDPEKTSSRFITHPITGDRLYRTGDLGRYFSNGQIEFLGRADSQVKIRGHRIELGEIEATLLQHPGIAAAVAGTPDRRRLVAWYVPRPLPAPDAAILPRWETALAAARRREFPPAPIDIPRAMTRLGERALLWLVSGLARLGLFRAAGDTRALHELLAAVDPARHTWLTRALGALVDAGWLDHHDDRYTARAAFPERPPPLADGDPTDVEPYGDALPDLLTGARSSLELFFAGGDLDAAARLYGLGFDEASALVAALVAALAPTAALEIGAGVGTTTRHVLPVLPPGTDYLFTDISRAFLDRARQTFARPGLRTALLDIDRELEDQSIDLARQDLVLASGVLHVARRVDAALARLARLLRPGGALVLVEHTRFLPMLHLLPGLQPGFDAFEDRDLRPAHCLLSAEQWSERLRLAGFDRVDVLDSPTSAATGLRVLVARRDPTAPAAILPTPDELAAHLAARLPAIMVPGLWVPLAALPLSPNGKLDRKALPTPAEITLAEHAGATPLQTTIARVWAETLGVPAVGLHDDYFALGGDSLLAVRLLARLREALDVDVPLRVLFAHPTVAGLADQLAGLSSVSASTLRSDPAHAFDPFPLTDLQQAYWLGRTEDLAGGDVASWVYVELDTPHADPQRWEAAWRTLIATHDALRIVLRPDGTQQVQPSAPAWHLPVLDLRGAPDLDARLADRFAALSQPSSRPLDRWPLFDLHATRFDTPAGERLRLHVGVDVLIVDGRSFSRLIGQWSALAAGDLTAVTAPPVSFRDVALALARAESEPTFAADRAWWLARLDQLPAAPQLPIRRETGASGRFVRRAHLLPDATWQRLQAAAGRRGLTPATALLTAYSAVLAAWSARPAFTLNLTLFHRPPLHPAIDEVIGELTLTSLLAVDFDPARPFAANAAAIQSRMAEDLDHRAFSGVRVLRELAQRHGGPVAMPVIFTGALGLDDAALGDRGTYGAGLSQTPQVWLDHQAVAGLGDGGVRLLWDAAEDRFLPSVLDAMFAAYVALLHHLSEETSTWDAPLPSLVPPAQLATRAALQTWPGTPATDTLHDPFLRQAAATPDALAVTSAAQSFTYRELADLSEHLARRLAHVLSTSPSQLIAVCLPKSPLQAIATLGVLRSGAAYLPIDPDLPPTRIRTLLLDGQASIVVTDPATAEKLRESLEGAHIEPVLTDTPAPAIRLPHVPPDALAYVLYTSGSTGQPKGVAIQHQAAWNTIAAINAQFSLTNTDRVLALSALSFDLSVYDLFGLLAVGAAIVYPPPDGLRDPTIWPLDHITIWNSVPQLMEMLLESGRPLPPSLRLVLWSGDWIPLSLPARVRQQLPHATLVSLGGATEAAIWSIAHLIQDIDPAWTSIPYGTPLPHQSFHVLDDSLAPRPDGVQGELYIAGAGLAQGYWRDPEKTAARFLTHPITHQRLYRTGDLGRYFSNGTIEFLGRADSQVKIRGHRIELGEIESTLLQHPAIAAAVAGTPDRRRLIAWYVPRPGIPTDDLEAFLAARLPAPLLPSALVPLPALPLSANGKLDRAALPLPRADHDDLALTPLQASVARIWADTLGVPAVGLHDDFFRLGGDSLVAVRLSARLRELLGLDLRVRDLFARPTIAELTHQLAPALPAPAPALAHDADHRFDPFPLTDLQHAYWLGRGSGVDLGGVAAYLYLELEPAQRDPARWERAWLALIAAHDALRTVVRPDGTQHVLKDIPAWTLPVLDLRGRPDPADALDALRARMSQQALASDRWPLFDLHASLRDAPGGPVLRLHIGVDLLIADGWSILQLLRQWAALADLDAPALPAPPLAFRDVVLAQAAELTTPEWDADRRWWLARLDDLPPAPELPLRTADTPPRYVRREHRLARDRWTRFQAHAAARGLTATSALLACYAAVLAAWSARPAFTLNLSLFHRPPLHPQIEQVIGDFTRTTLLSLETSAAEPFAAAARRAQARLVDDLEHARFSGVRVLRELAQRRGGPVRMPVVFTGAVGLERGADLGALGDHFWGLTQTPQVVLDNQVLGGPELLAVWDAAEDRFLPGVLDAMFAAYVALLHHLSEEASDWDAPLPSLVPTSQLATRAATQTWPGTPAVDTLHDPFLRQAAATPDALAVTSAAQSFTYRELADLSEHLACRLAHVLSTSPSALIAICLPKSPQQAIATLGVLRSGAAYLPIDPDLPPTRIRTLLLDGQASIVVTDPSTAERLRDALDGAHIEPVLTDTPAPSIDLPHVPPDALAYVIYTSGSTGQPKGVAIQHSAAWNTIAAINTQFSLTHTDRVLALSALSFDLSVYDLFGLLAVGAAIVYPPPDGLRDPTTWPLDQITIWNTVPQLMEMLLESGRTLPSSLRLVLWSGDWIPLSLPSRVRAQLPHATLVSLGGATEAAIWSIAHLIQDIDPAWTSIPYGTPLPHQSFHVLDDSLAPRPDGVQGELYIGGAGLAQGYWHDPEKTSTRFLTHPITGDRLYRTGDLGRYFSNGEIEFLGRADSQVKIRGHRIELGEIEATLLQHPAIAAAVAGTPDRRRLIAWYVPRPGLPTDDLDTFLAARLPAPLLPSALVPLSALPLSANGKLDRAALPLPRETGDHRHPNTPLERAVAGVWSDLLGHPTLGVDDPFFQLGGDSLTAVRVAARLTTALGRDVPVRLLLGNPTVADLARAIAALPTTAPLPALLPDPAHRFDPFPLTDVQRAYWLGRAEGFALGGVAAWIALEFEPTITDPARWEAAWQALVAAHDALRTVVRPDGTQQVLRDIPAWTLPVLDLRGRPDADTHLADLRRELSGQLRPADRWPLFDLRAARLDGPDGPALRLFFGLDVLLADGFSVVLLLQQWARLARESAPTLAPPVLAFRDIVCAQHGLEDSPEFAADRQWWQSRLDALPPAPELPLARDATAQAPRFARRVARLAPARLRRLQQRAAARGTTPANALLTAYSAVLAAWSARPAFTLNLTLFHRPALHPAIEEVVGDFTRTSLLAVDLPAGAPFTALARRVHDQLADDLDHNRFSGIRVLRELSARRGAPVLMPVVFTSGLSMGMASALRELGRPTWGVTQTPQVWLDHQLAEDDDGLLVMWDAAEERFLPGVLDAMFAAYTALLHHLSEETDAWDAPLPSLVPPAQLATRAAVQIWPGAPASDTLHAPFLRQAAATPDALALIAPTQSFTYRELADLSEHLACRLAHVLSASPSQLIAVCLPKSPLQAIATLGILRSGAAYLPIDPDLPPARIRTLLLDGQAKLVVTDPSTAEKLRDALEGAHIEPVLTDTPAPAIDLPKVPPDALAYVIYTSGSTGQPKGVAIQHQAVWNTIAAINAHFSLTHTDRVLALSALSFDLSVYDLFGLLAVGAAIVYPPPDGLRDPTTWPLDHITIWNSVPQLMEMLLESGRSLPSSLRLVLWSGDWIPLPLPSRVRAQLPHATLVSLGGATEAAIWSISHLITDIDPAWTSIPYGAPLPHQSFHVLDDSLAPRPDGVQGELYIAGAGLAQGYWHDPEKTSQRFITHPITHQRLYRTGDLGRYFSNGEIEFLGRADSQVKIRGHRIELGEIEATLAQHPGIAAAAVAGTPDRRRLLAWYVPRPLPVDPSPAAARWETALAAADALHAAQPDAPPEFAEFLARSTAWTADQIAAAFAALGFFRAAGERWTATAVTSAVVPPFHRWVRRALHLLEETGHLRRDGDTFLSLAPAPASDALLAAPRDLDPGELALLRLLQRHGAALPEILTGRRSPLEILFEGGQSTDALAFYAGGFAEANALVATLLDALQAGQPRRILEFGAGVGGTTRALLPRLAAGSTYTFTDVSRFFLESAARELHTDGLRTALLDIDRDPRAQGFAAASQDLVIGASVLHVARRLDVAIGHLARLVAPGGALVLIEATRLLPLLHLVMALQPGFDNFEDTDLRPEHCLLAADAWTDRLRAGGFDLVRAFARPGSLAERTGVQVLVARRSVDARVLADVPPDALRSFAAARLPDALLPAAFIPLDALPLSANGKLDRAALPVPRDLAARDAVAPRSPLERTITAVWADVLGLDAVSVHDPFFAVGGDSLSAVRVAARLGEALGRDVPVRLLFANPDAAALATQLDALAPAPARPALAHDADHRHDPFPLTDVQRAYWLGRTEGIELGGVGAWVYLEFETDLLDPAAWERSWRSVIAAHDALRTIVRPDGTQQVLEAVPPWTLPVVDLTDHADPRPALLAVRAAMAQQLRPADRWPLFDLRATRHGDTLRLHFGLDVLVADGWSMMALLRQWGEGARSDMSPRTPAIGFRDVALALARAEDGPEFAADRAWWLARLDALPPAPALPLLADAAHATPRFGRRMARLDAARWARVQTRAAALGLTPAAVLLTAYATVLAAWSAAPAFTINLTLFDRPPLHPEIEAVIGDFTQTALLAVEHRPHASFAAAARRLHAQLTDDLAHRSFSGIRALRELAQRRGAPVLMPVVFTSGLSMGIDRTLDVLGRPIWGLSQTPQVWLDHQVGEDEDGLFFNWDAAESRFQPGALDAMFAAYTALLDHLSAETASWDHPPPPALPASQLATRAATQTWSGAPAIDTLHAPFLRQAAATPDAIALIAPAQSLTYRELADLSHHLACRLAHVLSVTPSALIAVCLPKGPQQAIATLGVLHSGAAYLPIDPDLPPTRIRTLLLDGQASIIVTDPPTAEKLRDALEGAHIEPVLTDTPAPAIDLPRVPPDALAYVLYTSGSTGQPKGVAVQHQAAWNTIAAINAHFSLTHTDRVLALSALSFDLSVYDLFGLLAVGAAIVYPPPDGLRDPTTWPLDQITIWNSVPQLMEMLLESGRPLPSTLRLVLWSGDWIPLTLPPRVRAHVPHATLVSLGGATEAAIWSISHVIHDIDPAWTSIPYGAPLPHQSFHVLDDALAPRPDGVRGELYIGGAGLAYGYWRDPKKTAERFITHPLTGERLYRTGDLGRYFPNGTIEFLGRADSQVKIRGNRIELGEIEATLAQHPGVAAVVAGTPDRRRLLAWYVPRPLPVPPSPAAPAWDAAVTAARAAHLAQPPSAPELLAATDALGARAVTWIAAGLARLGLFTADGQAHDLDALHSLVTPAYHRWLRRGLDLLQGSGLLRQAGTTWIAPRALSPAAPPPLDLGPAGAHLVDLLDRYGQQLAPILRGEASALELFYAGGQVDAATDFYADAFTEALTVLAAFLDVLPPGLRALEVGGGGGGTTRVALPHARASSYLFTDVSRLFLEHAARAFPGARTAVLDLDRPPADQDLRPGQFDLLIAGGALHVARELRATLAHLAGLLAPGGALVLIEATRFWPMMQLLTALQPGFDGFTDTDLRRDHCLLDLPGWTAVLADAGFDRVEPFAAPGSRAAAIGVALLVARRDPAADVRAAPDPHDLREYAAARLPDALVPAALVPLAALPLSANGKLDRAALPLPAHDPSAMRKQPATALERTIAGVWTSVLGLSACGADEPFFALGGDSLSAVRVAARLGDVLGRDVPLRLLLANPDVAGLARALEAAAPGLDVLGAVASAPPLEPDPSARFEPFPLTDVQRAYWLGRDPGLALGGVATWFYLEFEPELADPAAWERAWQLLLGTHDALRTVVRPDGAQQVLRDMPAWTLPVLDLRGREGADVALAGVRAEMQQRVLPADRFPLFDLRASLFDGPAGPTLRLHFGLDLLVADGWGMMTLIGQWGALAHGGPPPTAPPVSFRDCVVALSREEGSPAWQADREWWQSRLDAIHPPPALPLVPAADGHGARFVRREATLDGPRWQRLRRSAARHGLTPASALLAAFARILAAWSERPELTINLTLFNRPPLHPQIEQVVGDFTSTTLLATESPAGEAFAAAAARLQARLTADLEHRRFGGLRVMRELSQHRGEAPLFPVVFTSGLSMGAPEQLRGGRYVHGLSQTPQVLLDHQVGETGDGLLLTWDAAEDRFLPGTLDAMFAAYTALLHALADAPEAWSDAAGRELPAAQQAARARVNRSEGAPPRDTLHAPFVRQAARTPDAPAVLGPDLSFSYAELAARSAALAHRLIAAPPSPLVAVCLPRGAAQVVAVLAILRAGRAYLPIDPDLPPARIHTLLTDAGATVVVTDPATRARLAEALPDRTSTINVLQDMSSPPPGALPDVDPDALAYVIYTSGSTGRPKGVAVQHAAAWNTVAAINDRFAVGPADRVLALSSLSFDLSVYDLVGPLAVGGAVVIPADPRDPQTWHHALAHGVTLWNSVPQLLDLYLDGRGALPDGLRLVLLSGDWIPVGLPGRVRQQVPAVRLVSLGGATEASIWSIAHEIGRVDPRWTSIPYGTPLPHQTWRVRGPDGRDCPDQVVGELWIGGAGLAQGYWNDPARTAERFVVDPRTGERLYRTGDLGRYRADGSLELVGRIDGQVKIAGHRVELGEVEAHLSRQPGVGQAVALALGERDARRLVAAVVGASIDPEAVRAALAASLPAAMVPTRILALDAVPLGATGKVDRRALADLFARAPAAAEPAPAAAPTGLAARALAIAREVIGLPDLTLEQNLLRLGATSIDLIRLGNRLIRELGIKIESSQFMLEPTLAALMAKIGADPSPPPTATETSPWTVIDDPDARDAFKATDPGLRKDLGDRPFEPFTPDHAPEALAAYARRRSRRHFALTPIDRQTLAGFLAPLRRGPARDDGRPGYHYASAGGVYPIQTYLHVKAGRVAGLGAGAYHYDPLRHGLVAVRPGARLSPRIHVAFLNQPIAEEAAFSLFLVGEMAAMGPLYGADATRLALLEAGAIAHLLEASARDHGLGTCQIGQVEEAPVRACLDLAPSHALLHTLLGGPIDPIDRPATDRKARMIERIRRLAPHEVQALLAARKATPEDD